MRLLCAILTFFFAHSAAAGQSMLEIFDACEESVETNSLAPLLPYGDVLEQSGGNTLIGLQTEIGAAVVQYVEVEVGKTDVVTCQIWGAAPDIVQSYGFLGEFVTWDSVADLSRRWHEDQASRIGRVSLTDTSKPGFVIAHCGHGDQGMVLSSQPARSGALLQVLPKTDEPQRRPVIHFMFTVTTALPGYCQSAVDRFKARG